MKYAIIESGGKQYKAVEGGAIEVDLLPLKAGDKADLASVLLVVDGEKISVGTPVVKGAKIQATVVGHVKGPKLEVFHYRAKKRIRKHTGHRQKFTRLQIESISVE